MKLNLDGTGRAGLTDGTNGSGAIGVGGVGKWAPNEKNKLSFINFYECDLCLPSALKPFSSAM